jgi:hypothetical protein
LAVIRPLKTNKDTERNICTSYQYTCNNSKKTDFKAHDLMFPTYQHTCNNTCSKKDFKAHDLMFPTYQHTCNNTCSKKTDFKAHDLMCPSYQYTCNNSKKTDFKAHDLMFQLTNIRSTCRQFKEGVQRRVFVTDTLFLFSVKHRQYN